MVYECMGVYCVGVGSRAEEEECSVVCIVCMVCIVCIVIDDADGTQSTQSSLLYRV